MSKVEYRIFIIIILLCGAVQIAIAVLQAVRCKGELRKVGGILFCKGDR